MNKKGLSNIVVTVLLILIAIAAVALIWGYILPLIKSGSGGNVDTVTVGFKIIDKSVLVDSDNNLSFDVQRDLGKGNVSGIKIVLTDSNKMSYVFEVNKNIAELELIHVSASKGEHNLQGRLTKIEVYPIILSKSGAKIIPSATSAVYVFKTTDNVDAGSSERTIHNITVIGKTTDIFERDTDVVVSDDGKYAFVTYGGGSNVVASYNVENKTNPVLLNSVASPINPSQMVLRGNYLYIVGNGDSRLFVYDVSNPTSINKLSEYSVGASNNFDVDATSDGNYVFIANTGSLGLQIVNLTDRLHPVKLVGFNFGAGGVAVGGDYAYVTDYNNKLLKIYNLTDKTNIGLVSSTSVGKFPVPIEVSGNYVYVGEYNYTSSEPMMTYLLDIRNIAYPLLVANITTSAYVHYNDPYRIRNNDLYIDNNFGVEGHITVYDISDVANPVRLQDFNSGRLIHGMDVGKGYIYLASREG